MRLQLDLEGVITSLEIKKYRPSTKDNWDDEWCKVSFSLLFNNYINYNKKDDELLLCCEVERLRDKLKTLLLDELDKTEELSFIEPDFNFILNPKKIDNQLSLFSEHSTVVDADAELKIYLWNEGCLTANYISLCLSVEDIEYLKDYLNLLTGVIDKSNPVIENMINKNIIIE